MRVAGIGVAIPSLEVGNRDILRRIAANAKSAGQAQAIQRSVASLLEAAGSDVRYYLDASAGELPRELLARAMQKALADAGQPAEAIDLLLYCSVGRGFLAPGNAYFCAQQLGIRCACFDVNDACMSWLRAAQVAHDGMAAGRYRNVYAEIMPRYGNVISASLPLGLRKASDEGRLKPGDDVVLIGASAGVSVGVARFLWTQGGR